MKKLHLASLTLLLGISCAQAAAPDPALYGGLQWRLIGPFRGGRVLAVSGVRGDSRHWYFGSVDGGVWETKDTGRTWQPIFDAMHVGSIGALAVAPSDPNVIYVGSGEADMRSDIAYGNGMYKSTDAGKTWEHIGLEDSFQIGKILVDPANPDVVFVAVLGHGYGPNETRGVFRSRDGGKTWQKVLYKDADTGAIDLAFGADTNTVYASLWQTRRPPWNVYPPSNGPGSGLYKSSDGGASWIQLTKGLPSEGLGHIGLATAPGNRNIVYALADAKQGGLYRSDDAGADWTLVSGDKRIWGRGWYFEGVSVDPKDPDVVYASNTAMFKSTDGGKTFLPFLGDPTGDDFHTLWIDPDDGQRMISGVDQGTIISQNGGKTWTTWYNQPTGQFYHVITDHRFPYHVYGAQQDSGAAEVPSRSNNKFDGINMTQFHEITAGGESGTIAPDPLDSDIVYGGTVDKLDRKSEQTANVDPTLAYPDIYRSEWTLPLTFSPKDPHALYFGNQHLFRTRDGGKHWALLSPDLTQQTLTVPPNLDATTAATSTATVGPRRGVIYAIAPSRFSADDIWVGTDDGLLWRTRDSGGHWQDVTPKGLVPWSKVGIIEAGHFSADTAYAAIDRHRVDDYKPYIYRTHDGGKSWTLVADGIPDGSFVNAVREDPVKQGLLYAGTELGVYLSFDDGDHWQSLQQNLPVTSIRDIDVHHDKYNDDLVIATHGRAFWVLDDISALRQLDSAATGAALFKPADAVRLHLPGFTGTPMHSDEPQAPNPPDGAILDYWLKDAAGGEVTLDILDAKGKPVRHFSSADKHPAPDLSKTSATPDWSPQPTPLYGTRGMHRFVWDLHYPAPEGLGGDGVWVLPGNYTVKLTADGKSYSHPLTVLNDPRVKASQADLAKQQALAFKVQAERVKLAAATDEVMGILKQLEAAEAKAPVELAARLKAFEQQLTADTELHAEPPGYGQPGSAPEKLGSLSYVSNAMDALQPAVENADAAPSPDALKGFAEQQAKAATAIARWKLGQESLPPLNMELQKAGLAPLTVK